jgi:hypothetical protein
MRGVDRAGVDPAVLELDLRGVLVRASEEVFGSLFSSNMAVYCAWGIAAVSLVTMALAASAAVAAGLAGPVLLVMTLFTVMPTDGLLLAASPLGLISSTMVCPRRRRRAGTGRRGCCPRGLPHAAQEGPRRLQPAESLMQT